MKVRIDFPDDVAAQKASEAREWEPGMPMVWEAEDINTPMKFERKGEGVVVKSAHTKIELTKAEVRKICDLYE